MMMKKKSSSKLSTLFIASILIPIPMMLTFALEQAEWKEIL